MKQWFSKVGRSALLVAAMLFVSAFAVVQLLRMALRIQDVDAGEQTLEFPIVCGLILGGTGFGLVFLFESMGSGWRWLSGGKPVNAPTSQSAT